jgi:hypothetical protein
MIREEPVPLTPNPQDGGQARRYMKTAGERSKIPAEDSPGQPLDTASGAG